MPTTSCTEAVTYKTGESFFFKVGSPVICNGFPGNVVKVCTGQLEGMVEVRLPGGLVCVSASFPDCYPAPAITTQAIVCCDHPVGQIPGFGEVYAPAWNKSLESFVAVVEDFNVRGQRQQINHPGFIEEYKFCPYCGHSIDRRELGLLAYHEAFDALRRSGADRKA